MGPKRGQPRERPILGWPPGAGWGLVDLEVDIWRSRRLFVLSELSHFSVSLLIPGKALRCKRNLKKNLNIKRKKKIKTLEGRAPKDMAVKLS